MYRVCEFYYHEISKIKGCYLLNVGKMKPISNKTTNCTR